jgi:hypothetical protein
VRREKVFLSYFGTGDPRYEGIHATMLPTLPKVGAPRPWHALSPGVYAISATMLQHVYSPVRGEWTLELEVEYQRLRPAESAMLQHQANPGSAPDQNWDVVWSRYETLRFARLCHYLRARRADASIGHSIRIYRLTEPELRGAVGGTAQEWRALIDAAPRPGATRATQG